MQIDDIYWPIRHSQENAVIDVQQIRELIELMVEHNMGEIRVKEGETVVSLRRGPSGEVVMAAPQYLPQPTAMPQAAMPADIQATAEAGSEDSGLIAIKAPMVGTFYASSEPESPPFVSVGSEVGEETPVCIIEAMKVFNEIKAEVSGTIEQILVRNEQAVEYGQTIMLVRPRS